MTTATSSRAGRMFPFEVLAERPHGTRARYVGGCRCDACRAANARRCRDRQAAITAAAAAVVPTGPPIPGDLARGGKVYRIKRCPGANGSPCVRGGAWLRNSGYAVCRACVERATVWNGVVGVETARRHLMKLRRAGVGYKAVAAASDVPTSVLGRILARDGMIRATTERAILAVSAGAREDGALVAATRMNRMIAELRSRGFTLRHLAMLLGYASGGSLQVGVRARARAATVARVERIYRRALRGEVVPDRDVCDAPEARAWLDDLLARGVTARYLSARLGVHITRCGSTRMRTATASKIRALHAECELLRQHGTSAPDRTGAELDLPRDTNGQIIGFLIGRAAAISDWSARSEDRITRRLTRASASVATS